MKKKILFLSANPGDTQRLRLDKEVREIKEGLRRAKNRDQFNIVSEWAVSFNSLRRALLDHEPQIVHFSGHGEKNGIMLEGELGISVTASSKAISRLFELCSNDVECVILNACYSAPQASAINRHINYVIGMPGKINDYAAIEFSVGFYDALGAGRIMEDAFKFGIIGIQQVFPELSPQLFPILLIPQKSVQKKTRVRDMPSKKENSRAVQRGLGRRPILKKRKEKKELKSQPSQLEKLLNEGLKNLDLEDYKLT